MCALQRQAPAFLQLIGDPELLEPRFLDPMQRVQHDAELGARVERWFSDKTKSELLELGEKHKVPIGAVLTPLDLLGNAGARRARLLRRGDDAGRRRARPRPPVPRARLARRRARTRRPPTPTRFARDWLGGAR